MADFVRCMHSKDSQMIALYRKTPIFKKSSGGLRRHIIFIWGSLPEPPPFGGGMGAGSSCGGLGGKAGPQPTRKIGNVIDVVVIRPDNNENVVANVIRGTKAPPNRRGDGGMIICNLGVTSFVIIILGLIVLFILVGVASRTKDFKLGKIKQVIGSSCNITISSSPFSRGRSHQSRRTLSGWNLPSGCLENGMRSLSAPI